MRRFATFPLLLVSLFVAAVGCDDPAVVGHEVPNVPPDTQVEATPPDLAATSFRIEFYWSGSDFDGEVAYFEWLITDNGTDNVFSPADTVGAWNRTTAFDSTFVVDADVPDFPADLPYTDDPRKVRFWQTHTFLIRAVDDDGAADPSPAIVSFTAATIAPTVEIVAPTNNNPASCLEGPLAPSFRWKVDDPDNPEKDPPDVRYALVEWPEGQCVARDRFDDVVPIAELVEHSWSPWISYEAPADSGRFRRYPVLEGGPGKVYFFVVQARDIAGAVTPVFEFGRNVFELKTSDLKFPVLTVRERALGAKTTAGVGKITHYDLVAGQPLDFTWSADASSYGGFVEEYRYGFDVVDPSNEDDPNWAVGWGPNWLTVRRPAGFTSGSRNLVVQARDNSGNITQIVYDFQVIEPKRRADQRPLLVVDDSRETRAPEIDFVFDSQWKNLLFGVREFSPVADVLDVDTARWQLNFARVNDYRALLWLVSSDPETYFASELAPVSPNNAPFNWLETYQRFVGNVMLIGPGVMRNSIDQTAGFNPIYPIVFNYARGAQDYSLGIGLGVTYDEHGRSVNVGTLRYPYTAWCLESIDQVDAVNVGRRNNPRGRSLQCDSYTYVRVASEYVDRYRPAPSRLANLYPIEARVNAGATRDIDELDLFAQLSMTVDEFYNVNAANRPLVLTLRDCQTPMFEAIARMDVDDVEVMQPYDRNPAYHLPVQERLVDARELEDGTIEELCPAVLYDRRPTSTVTGAPVVIASTAYSRTKQDGTVPFEDYLWGFNPLGFQRAGVQRAVEWILLERWRLNESE